MEYKDITLGGIKKAIKEAFFGKEPIKKRGMASITHHEWEEDGQIYSMWKINTGMSSCWCNDAGKKLFDEEMLKQGKLIK